METKIENENFGAAQDAPSPDELADYTVSSLREMWEVIQKLYPEKLGRGTKPPQKK